MIPPKIVAAKHGNDSNLYGALYSLLLNWISNKKQPSSFELGYFDLLIF
jgi:hypothetical protein